MENYKYGTSVNGYTIMLAKPSDLSEIISFLNDNYNQEERVFASLRLNASLTEEEDKLLKADQERFVTTVLKHFPCLVAIHDESYKIVGVNMMILKKNPSIRNTDDEAERVFGDLVQTAFLKEYFEFFMKIENDANLFERFSSSKKALEFYAIAVDVQHRRLGLSKDLTDAGVCFAKTFPDVGFVYGIYTSAYSKTSATKVGMHSILDVDLLTYKNTNGECIFLNTPPHNIVSIMVLQV